MTSKDQVKTALIAELKNTPQYAEVLAIKQLILNQITEPNVQQQIVYKFSVEQTKDEQDIVNMCLMVEFGITTNNMNETVVVIDMIDFLE